MTRPLVCFLQEPAASPVADLDIDILRAQASLCDRPHDDLSNVVRVTAYVTGIIPIVVIVMRFTSRHLGGNKLWWDDWIHLASVVSTPSTVLSILLTIEQGSGHPDDDCVTFEHRSRARPSHMGLDISARRDNREI
jgi:hypothetical protein